MKYLLYTNILVYEDFNLGASVEAVRFINPLHSSFDLATL